MITAQARSQVLADMLSPNPAERAELVAAGVARGTVDALYPPEYANLIRSVSELLTTHGVAHLQLGDYAAGHWEEQRARLDRIGFGMPGELQAAYWAEFELSCKLAESFAIHEAVRQHYALVRDARGSHDIANCYLSSLFMGYWLLKHAAEVGAAQEDLAAVLNWIVEHQLPRPVGFARA